uniref:VWFD domain-containing protein n=1 Tax=Astyanax mexicanus TaxID=7994 RepID=A0A3B1II43_ASTMX
EGVAAMGTLTMLGVWMLSAVITGITAQHAGQNNVAVLMFHPGLNVDHSGQVCSTWGNFHFNTFDGQFFQLPYACNYILATMCDSIMPDFNIQLRRTYDNDIVTSTFTLWLQENVIKLHNGNITMNEELKTIPSNQQGVRIERSTDYVKIRSSKLGLTVYWDKQNSLWIEINEKYSGQICGLCGDFNDVNLTTQQYGLKWKSDAITETCEQTEIHPEESMCEEYFYIKAFSGCHSLLPVAEFVEACIKDLCQCNSSQADCLCDTLSEYSRQCAHAGGQPQSWRTNALCDKKCPFNLEHSECSRPCQDTCSNQQTSQVCAEHCVDGCFCPSGTVFNDIEKNGCVSVNECPCTHNGNIYQAGESYTRTCQKCKCTNGRWNCVKLDCLGTCSLLGGSHITTYDGKAYTFQGNCYYILSKDKEQTVSGSLAQCGTQTCLTEVQLSIQGTTVSTLKFLSDAHTVNDMNDKLCDRLTIFRPSTFFIIAQTPSFQLTIQMVPIMQVYILVSPEKKGTLNGLCGNFNDIQADDFTTESGQKEGTATTFANIWKARSDCPDVDNLPQYPCNMNMEKEKYAKEWCHILTDTDGVFSPCHAEVNPNNYKDRCVYDTCQCANSEECMCAALSSYAHVCAAKGVLLDGWRNNTCKFSKCEGNMQYSYSQTSCGSTCRSLSGIDYTCKVKHTPVDGCGCAEGTYLNDKDECVSDSSCPCYYNNQVMVPSEVITVNGAKCKNLIKWLCILMHVHFLVTDCKAPMYYFNCSDADPGAKGIECQKSCQTQSPYCISTPCQSGCMCPNGQLVNRHGTCVTEDLCECFHNGLYYQPYETIQENWQLICTTKKCPATCTIFGEGHYKTFDGTRYDFNGDCEYLLAQDYCSNSFTGSFRIITENIPCGTTGTTCSKSIKIFLGVIYRIFDRYLEMLSNKKIPYKIHTVGIYRIIEASNGLVLYWDNKTSLHIRLSPSFQGKVCGLCGNYDGNGKNDFVTRAGEEVVEPLKFGNSWRVFTTCSKAKIVSSPCELRPHRHTWAAKHCNIINEEGVFGLCHNLVSNISRIC